jgi:hypothetical protein
MDITYGCQCINCAIHHGHKNNNAPCAHSVKRNDTIINVCTRCKLSGDTVVAQLFDTETDSKPFFDYDTLGALCMVFELQENNPQKCKTTEVPMTQTR